MQIGTVKIEGHAVLAPMAGVGDRAFRVTCRRWGASYVVSEMASARGLVDGGGRTAALLTVTGAERPMGVQLFGSDPAVIAQAVRIAERFGPDVIDLNMGCPAPKITSNGGGAALMKDLPLAGRVIEAAVGAAHVPVTVKMRTGWDEDHLCAAELARIAERCGAAAVTVHGRTRSRMYAPPVDLEAIAEVKAAVSIPVIGNGDVRTPEDAARMLKKTGCDAVMIGRGALGAPWIFRQVEQYLAAGRYDPAPPAAERFAVLRRQVEMMCRQKGLYNGMMQARRHAACYLRGLRGAAALREEAVRIASFGDLDRLIGHALSAGEEKASET